MSAVEAAIEKVKVHDEGEARILIKWLESQAVRLNTARKPLGAKAMIGFARRFRKEARTRRVEWRNLGRVRDNGRGR